MIRAVIKYTLSICYEIFKKQSMILRKIIYIKIFYAQSYIDYYGKPAGVQPAKKNNDKKALLSVIIQMNSDELNCPGFTNCNNCFLIIL